jgi:hypothetical protein
MPELSQDLARVIFAANMTRIETHALAIKENQKRRVSAAQEKCLNELTRLKSKRVLYQSEDRRYHEMMEQRSRI